MGFAGSDVFCIALFFPQPVLLLCRQNCSIHNRKGIQGSYVRIDSLFSDRILQNMKRVSWWVVSRDDIISRGETMILDAEFIGVNVRNIRKSANQSQETFAEIVDVSTHTVSNIENGVVVPSLQTIVNIAERFNCSVDSIIRKDWRY